MINDKDLCEVQIANYCLELLETLIKKYRKGKQEHGDNWQGVNCPEEIAQEVKDILIYNCINIAQKTAKKD